MILRVVLHSRSREELADPPGALGQRGVYRIVGVEGEVRTGLFRNLGFHRNPVFLRESDIKNVITLFA